MTLTDPGTPSPCAVEILNPAGKSPVVLLCEHASNFIPDEYDGLGLSEAELQRHIAWDIGAANVTRAMSRLLDAPAFLGGYSRLLIDLNRPLNSPTSIVTLSERTAIPANAAITPAERALRTALCFQPFHDAVELHLAERKRTGSPILIVALHSFTPSYHGDARPWHAGIIFDRAAAFGEATIERLRANEPNLNVGANVPYDVTPDDYYGLLVYGDYARNPAILIEVRQDLLAQEEQQNQWAKRLAAALAIDVALDSRNPATMLRHT
jgi:predicted N-formylglutamate amidohydrolase